jgi:hypothetical protein
MSFCPAYAGSNVTFSPRYGEEVFLCLEIGITPPALSCQPSVSEFYAESL